MTRDKKGLTYAQAGVDYERIDPAKRLAQEAAAATAGNFASWGLAEVAASRGSSAYVWEEGDAYRAFVQECLGTKSLVAAAVRPITGRTHFDTLAQDTVAMIVNDIAAVGAEPQVVGAYWAVGSSEWFDDAQRSADLATGWAAACNEAGAVWGGGETPALGGVIAPGGIDLAGACLGRVQPKERLVLGDGLAPGDAVVLVAASGIHANGLSLARRIADGHADGYAARLDDGTLYGEALLAPTHLYPRFLAAVWAAGVEVRYLSNITGHGWRKIMRAPRDLGYRMHFVPPLSPLFRFLVEQGGLSPEEAYGSLNMGAGYAVYVPAPSVAAVIAAAADHGLAAWDAGRVEEGPRRVEIEPVGVVFEAGALRLS